MSSMNNWKALRTDKGQRDKNTQTQEIETVKAPN